MNLEKVISNIEIEIIKGNKDRDITGISSDSRNIEKGFAYIALPGTKTDGENFIPQVIEKGASLIVCSDTWISSQEVLNNDVTYIGVKNRRKAFALVSSNFYDNPTNKLNLVGVTGTNGKTTTTHLIEDILKEKGSNTGIIGTLYIRYGEVTEVAKYTTPMSDYLQNKFAEMVKADVDSVVMEVSSHALEQSRVGGCNYKVAVFTNITQDHLDYHPTFEDYKEAKAILFNELLSENGYAVINADDPSFEYFKNHSKGKVLTYGLKEGVDFYAKDIDLKMDSTSFNVVTPEGEISLKMNLVGKFNVYNTLSALACGYALGISLEKCKNALEKTKGIPGRIEIVTPQGHPYTVVVDYAHTPDSLENILKSSREFTKNRLISVFGCGGDRDRTKRPIMGEIAARLSDIAIVTSDNPRTEDPDFIIGQILEGIENKEKALIDADRRNAIKKAVELAKEGDTVVIAGKGHEDYQIFKDKTIHFDDREVAREFIK
jgi:UDP-N-acetylmuramoyl-L-alanyl-D-glutamate--2,6-diaminopimelate ligase